MGDFRLQTEHANTTGSMKMSSATELDVDVMVSASHQANKAVVLATALLMVADTRIILPALHDWG